MRISCRQHEWEAPLSRKLLGETAMTHAERSRRRCKKAKAMRDAATQPADRHGDIAVAAQANGMQRARCHRRTARREVGKEYPRVLCHPDGRTSSWIRPSSTTR